MLPPVVKILTLGRSAAWLKAALAKKNNNRSFEHFMARLTGVLSSSRGARAVPSPSKQESDRDPQRSQSTQRGGAATKGGEFRIRESRSSIFRLVDRKVGAIAPSVVPERTM